MAVGRLDRREEMVRNFEKFQKGHFYIYTGDNEDHIPENNKGEPYSNWIANIRT